MTCLQQRQNLLTLLDEACAGGARLAPACTQVGLSVRTVQRWRYPEEVEGDRRVAGLHRRSAPAHKLSDAESQAAMAVLNRDEFKHLPPSQIVPRLADQGCYIASESTLYRLLHLAGQMRHRRLERAPQKRTRPRALTATRPGQVFCWDITYLPTCVCGTYFYLYLFVDLFSRKIVGWQVFDSESAALAAQLLQDICIRHGIVAGQLVVHSDNGSPMKGETMLAMMQRLGVAPSRSRRAVAIILIDCRKGFFWQPRACQNKTAFDAKSAFSHLCFCCSMYCLTTSAVHCLSSIQNNCSSTRSEVAI